MLKRSKALLVLVVFLLVFAPLSALADTEKSKTVNYVALGDSLAAGVLSDNKLGTGYVDIITEELKALGYEVNLKNAGVPGAQSPDVLQALGEIEELANADIITISVGANDALAGLDASLLVGLDPKYLDPANVAILQGELESQFATAQQLLENVGTAAENTSITILDSQSKLELIKDNLKIVLSEDDYTSVVDTWHQVVVHTLTAKNIVADLGALPSLEKLEQALSELENAIGKLIVIQTLLESSELLDTELHEALSSVDNSIAETLEAVNNFIMAQAKATETKNKFEDTIAKLTQLNEMKLEIEDNIKNVGLNMGAILTTLKTVNPTAEIYVMGYYNALPGLPEAVIIPLLTGLNTAIETATSAVGATFIPTFAAFDGKYAEYLPNPANIHPSEAGYEAIAGEFMKVISEVFPGVEDGPQPIELGAEITVEKGQVLQITGTTANVVLPEDLPEGTTLTVSADEEALAKADGLKAIGDVLNFTFSFPAGLEDYEGEFQLVMGYSGNASDDVNIYYFNEETGTWEIQNGQVNTELRLISLTVSHFSTYGVFEAVVEEPEEETPIEPEEPEEGENPGENEEEQPATTDPDNNENDDDSNKQPTNDGETLPNTATSNYNMLVLGGILLLIGLSALIIQKKRVKLHM